MAKSSWQATPESISQLGPWLEEHVSLRLLPANLDLAMLATATFSDGSPVPTGPLVVLLKSTSAKEQVIYRAIREKLDAVSMAQFVDSLATWWVEDGAITKHRWALDSLEEWGTESSLAKVGEWLRGWIKKRKRSPALAALYLLARRATDSTLNDLDDIAHGNASPAFAELARQEFAKAAIARGLTTEQLADKIVPTLGLDETGARVFAAGKRQVRAILRPGGTIELRDDEGKILRSMPKGAISDAKSPSPSEWLKEIKKRLKGGLAHQANRLERAMIAGRSWPRAEWSTLFLQHPILRTLSPQIVWQAHGTDELILFRVAEDYTLADVDDREMTLPVDAIVAIPHPISWTQVIRDRWRQVFIDYRIEQPFPQIEREAYALATSELADPSIMRFVGRAVDSRLLKGHLKRRGWLMGVPGDGGSVEFHYRFFEEGNVSAVLLHDPVFVGGDFSIGEMVPLANIIFVPETIDRTGRTDLSKFRTIMPRDVSPTILSETIRDVERLRPISE